tara:strand:+ start:121 stop:675 length:555 start_codon:yes stop_codon:yes gene_type:complete
MQAQNFGGGVILGLSTSQVGGDRLGGFNKAGLLIGVFANKSISEMLSFQMEMTYIQKGSNNPKMNENRQEDISISYIEVPLLLQYHQSDKLKIEGGVLTAYLIDGYYNDLSGKISNETNPFINYDIGLLLGIDYRYSENISLNTRLSNSIFRIDTKTQEDIDTYNSFTKGQYNSVLSFALHYNF